MMELDGAPVTAEQAETVAVLAYGHFSSMLVHRGRVKGLDLHLERLVRDCELVFGTALDPDRVRRLLRQVAANCPMPTMLKATVFDPASLSPSTSTQLGVREPSVLVTTRAAPGRPGSADGVRLRSTQYVRDLPTVKHLGFFGPLRERRLARLAGVDDALFLNRGLVCEGPTWNLAVVLRASGMPAGEVIWPDDDCLPGVTRRLLKQVLDDAGMPWTARSVHLSELADLHAAFITSSGIGVHPVSAIDGVQLPGDPKLLHLLRSGYAALPGESL